MSVQNVVFLGAGGHAKVIYDVITSNEEYTPKYYCDDAVSAFYNLQKVDEAKLDNLEECNFVLGFGGVTPKQLLRRLEVFQNYIEMGWIFPVFTHQSTAVSKSSQISRGTTISPNATINAGVIIGEACIINTSAVVEHDVVIHSGAHICPGSLVLGGAKIGKCSLIGAGAVVLPFSEVPDNFLVKANTVYPQAYKNEQ